MVERSSAHILYCHVPRHLHLHLIHSFVFILNYIEIECMSPLASAHIINFSVTFYYIALFLRMRNEFSKKNSHTPTPLYIHNFLYVYITTIAYTMSLGISISAKNLLKISKMIFLLAS